MADSHRAARAGLADPYDLDLCRVSAPDSHQWRIGYDCSDRHVPAGQTGRCVERECAGSAPLDISVTRTLAAFAALVWIAVFGSVNLALLMASRDAPKPNPDWSAEIGRVSAEQVAG